MENKWSKTFWVFEEKMSRQMIPSKVKPYRFQMP